MATTRKTTDSDKSKSRRPPATTPEARENQMVAMAMDLAEKQMCEGTASSQVITHFLKAGSTRDYIEKERLRLENELLKTKKEAIESGKRVEELYGEALSAMRGYQGKTVADDDYDD